MNIENSQKNNIVEVGPYEVSKCQPIPNTDQVNVIWLSNESTGEGMSVDLDKLWGEF